MSDKDRVFALWWVYKPKTFRQAKQHVLLLDQPTDVTEGTLRVYYSQWKKSHGIQRRYRKAAPAAEATQVVGERADE